MFDPFIEPIEQALQDVDINTQITLLTPPNHDLGHFCIVVNSLAGERDPEKLAKELCKINLQGISEILVFTAKRKKGKGITYLNFKVDQTKLEELQTNYIENTLSFVFSQEYGYPNDQNGRAIVEHTSANPISPLHVGNLRNSVLGDTLARILKRSGFEVSRHFYVNDVGLQVSFVVIGYEFLRELGIKPSIKVDLWMGQVYAIMNCLYSIQSIKTKGSQTGVKLNQSYQLDSEEINNLQSAYEEMLSTLKGELAALQEMDKLSATQKRTVSELKRQIKKQRDDKEAVLKYSLTFTSLKDKFPELFKLLFEKVSEIDLMSKQSEYLYAYEHKTDERIVSLFREATQWVLDAFTWTLKRYNIEFDQFDFESDVSWSGKPQQLIDELAKSEFCVVQEGKGVRLSYPKTAINKLLELTDLKKSDIPIKGEIPDLQLRRSDGTALYAAKDIAYSLSKFADRDPDIIYNVISTEQTLPQFQLLLPLVELGYSEYASKMKHYGYELVELAGRPMSGRMAIYVTADAFYDETFIRSRMAKRISDARRNQKPPTNEQEWMDENKILRAVTLASTRFPLIDKSPNRRIILDIDQELDFKRNAGPFIQYAHARCCGILRKSDGITNKVNYSYLVDDFTVDLIKHLGSLNLIIVKSREKLDPSNITTWCFQLAQLFMKYYEKYPVLKGVEPVVQAARLQMIKAIRRGLHTGLEVLGIPSTERL